MCTRSFRSIQRAYLEPLQLRAMNYETLFKNYQEKFCVTVVLARFVLVVELVPDPGVHEAAISRWWLVPNSGVHEAAISPSYILKIETTKFCVENEFPID